MLYNIYKDIYKDLEEYMEEYINTYRERQEFKLEKKEKRNFKDRIVVKNIRKARPPPLNELNLI